MNTIRFEDWEAKQLEDPEFRAALEELEAAYIVARLRIKRGLTQAQLAEMVGTKQSSIARLESGASQPRLSFLRKIIEALGGKLELHVVDNEERTSLFESETVVSTLAQTPVRTYSTNWPTEPEQLYKNFWMVSTESPKPQRVVL